MSWSLQCKTIYRGEGWQFRTTPNSTTGICCLVDRSVHNTDVSCMPVQILVVSDSFWLFRRIYQISANKCIPAKIRWTLSFVFFLPWYQICPPFSGYNPFLSSSSFSLFVLYFFKISNSACVFIVALLHVIHLSLIVSLMFSFPFFYYFLRGFLLKMLK